MENVGKLTKLNCIVVHGCPPDRESAMNFETRTYDKHWIPWIKRALIANGIKTYVPQMPEPWEPEYLKYAEEFEKYEVNESTILIGHSCGCAFLVRWLGESKKKILKLILVAPWKIAKGGDEFKKAFYGYAIDESIKLRAKEIVMFTSDNEEADGKKSLQLFHQSLGGKVIELKGKGHYTLRDMGSEAFPELLNEILGIER